MLAATLGAIYGIYSGFELAENVPVKRGQRGIPRLGEVPDPRRATSSRPDSLAELIARINAIRRDHPALQHDRGLAFHPTDNDELLCYSKRSADGRDLILMVVNLDPFHMQHGFVQLPLADWGLTPHAPLMSSTCCRGERYFWRGEWNYVGSIRRIRVAHILHVPLPFTMPAEPGR